MTRTFLNLRTLPDLAAVEEHCERIGAVRVGDYRAHDGLRCLVEMPDVAIDRLATEALEIEHRARKLLAQAQGKSHPAGQQ